ncbi:protein LUTEIN DEFICIENT 5, chloroplastic [Dorcoceras hygrometricum]|uniref:Protein LUTEIN DEFICIENT 5, chloroplastic n=1 Tax=Dorcoceras hygrometricum TaxID=472368 RepID=A0A2Z7A1C0_9LAMI|nr:protein LUTEIN DEFICIENT 5, chloroplastic [Dorcoceras hygrometricum]
MTDWFLQALSVIPRGSWGDVARRFTMIRWIILPLLSSLPPSPPPAARRRKSRSDRSDEEIPSVKSSSSFLVQTGEGIGIPVVDRIRSPKPPTVEVPISS